MKKGMDRIGRTNFLINFSRQKNGDNGFRPSGHRYHRPMWDVMIAVVVILIIYLIGMGIYAHHQQTMRSVHHRTRVTRVAHHRHRPEKRPRRRGMDHIKRSEMKNQRVQKSRQAKRQKRLRKRLVKSQRSRIGVNTGRQRQVKSNSVQRQTNGNRQTNNVNRR